MIERILFGLLGWAFIDLCFMLYVYLCGRSRRNGKPCSASPIPPVALLFSPAGMSLAIFQAMSGESRGPSEPVEKLTLLVIHAPLVFVSLLFWWVYYPRLMAEEE